MQIKAYILGQKNKQMYLKFFFYVHAVNSVFTKTVTGILINIDFLQKYHVYAEERKSHRFGMTWGQCRTGHLEHREYFPVGRCTMWASPLRNTCEYVKNTTLIYGVVCCGPGLVGRSVPKRPGPLFGPSPPLPEGKDTMTSFLFLSELSL